MEKIMNEKGLKPIIREGVTYQDKTYWCPNCNNRVGGYVTLGSGENDWSYQKDKFCSECGTKIDWSVKPW